MRVEERYRRARQEGVGARSGACGGDREGITEVGARGARERERGRARLNPNETRRPHEEGVTRGTWPAM